MSSLKDIIVGIVCIALWVGVFAGIIKIILYIQDNDSMKNLSKNIYKRKWYENLEKKKAKVRKTKNTQNTEHIQYNNDTRKEHYSKLNKEIEEVIRWISVSEIVNTSDMFSKVADGKEEEVIEEIAKHLSLPMKVTIKHVSEKKHSRDGSYPLAEVIVGNIPRYGSDKLKNYPCTIILYPGYNSRPDRFIYVITHELCHYVLQSIRPRLSDSKKEERQTDLAIIFSGFRNAYKTGWQSYTSDSCGAGYILNENDVEYICRRYDSMLITRRLICEEISTEYRELLKKQRDKLPLIEKCRIILDHPKDILQDDLAAIGRCFSAISEKEIDKVKRLKESLKPFLGNKTRYGKMDDEKNKLKELELILNSITLPATEDVSILMKYADRYN